MTSRLVLLLATTAFWTLPLLEAAGQQPEPGAGAIALPTLEVQGGAPGPERGLVAREARTGTKTDTPLIETPQAISVITRDQMDLRQVQSLSEAVRYTPGIRYDAYGENARYDWFYLRGFRADTTGVFLDGLRFDAGALTGRPEAWGLERIEVLRGPSSVLFGQNAPGGVVNMVSRRPTDTPQGEVRLTAGSHARLQGAFATSGPLTRDGTWSYSLSGLLRDSNTQVDYTPDNRAFIAPALTWRPTSDTRLTLLSYYQYDETLGSEFLPYSGTVVPSAFGRIPRSRFTGEPGFDTFIRRQYGIGYEFEHRFNDTFTVRQNLRYGHVDGDWRQTYGLGLQPDGRTLNRYSYESRRESSAFQVDTHLQSRFATGPLQHTLLAGLDYSRATFDNIQNGATGTPLDLYAPVYGRVVRNLAPLSNDLQTRDQLGVYLQDQIRAGNWVLTLGGRHDWATTETESRLRGTTTTADDRAFTGRVGLVYLAPNGLAPFASYSTSFLPQLGTTATGAAFRPIEGEQVEVGLKFQPPGGNSFLQVAAFQITQRNGLTPDPTNRVFQVQTGEVEVRGVELEAVAEVTPGLRVIGAYTYLDAEITRANDGTVGNRPNGIPAHMASLYGDYGFRTGPLRGLGLGAGVRYIGNTPVGNANLALVPSVTLFDASVRFDLERLSPALQGMRAIVTASNLGDERHVASCDTLSACFYGTGRLVLGSLSYAW
ncbi:TonB-dependent siderophore receptor [Roseicella aerolata]|uniref:TonB-dependent siderophore receptor n=1 Tax=Roseicella aerolata TaxID=2883479 RepID=A0A9X1IJH2_9PROT|nr:TonB-dependent siderophore receptor [Roseicella aerolata]MCB4825284.1 TonB-dependent siderophore receptor [Roseicella aerolata]